MVAGPDVECPECGVYKVRPNISRCCVCETCAKYEVKLDAERARAERAEADLLTVAQTLGYSYEADGHASKPAPVDVLVGAVRELQQYADRATDQAARLAKLEAVAEAARALVVLADSAIALLDDASELDESDAATSADVVSAARDALAALDGGE